MRYLYPVVHSIPGVHFWSNWRTVHRGHFSDTGAPYIEQERRCSYCGKYQTRTEW